MSGPIIRLAGLSIEMGENLEGGAIYLKQVGNPVEISFCDIPFNKAQNYGGAVYLEEVDGMALHASRVDQNIVNCPLGSGVSSSLGMGGGLASFDSNVAVSDCLFGSFLGNEAKVTKNGTSRPEFGSAGGGGDIYQSRGTLKINYSTFKGAIAGCYILPGDRNPEDFTGDGGSLLIHGTKEDTSLGVTNVSFDGCQSYGNGGAINIAKDSSVHNRALFKKTWGITSWPPTVVLAEPSEFAGGAYARLERVRFVNCKGGWQGGAVSICGREVDAELTGCSFIECKGGETHERDGKGALAVGGGLQKATSPVCIVVVEDCVFHRCDASGNGGGLYSTIRAGLEVYDSVVNECRALDTATKPVIAGMGGGIHVSAGGTLFMTGTTIQFCRAKNNGGGLSVKSGDVDVFGGPDYPVTIRENSTLLTGSPSYGNGGGVYVTTSRFDDFCGAGHGAAFVWGHGSLNLSDGASGPVGRHVVVMHNEAKRWGGGVYAGLLPGLTGDIFDLFPSWAGYADVTAFVAMNVAVVAAAATPGLKPANLVIERSTPSWCDFGGCHLVGLATDIGIYERSSDPSTGAYTFSGIIVDKLAE